jgi:hypothetical protein
MDDYSKCKVDPSDPKFVDRFKQLHPDLEEDLRLVQVSEKSLFTYIVLTYDMNSPFVEKYKDWALRRRETAKASSFSITRGSYNVEAENIILGKTAEVNRFIVRYLFLQNDLEFVKFQSYQALYYNQVIESMKAGGIKAAEAKALRVNIDDLAGEVKVLQKSIFSGNETKDMLRSLYDFVANITYDFRPEQIADKKDNGEEVVDDVPYGKKHRETEKLGFLDDK